MTGKEYTNTTEGGLALAMDIVSKLADLNPHSDFSRGLQLAIRAISDVQCRGPKIEPLSKRQVWRVPTPQPDAAERILKGIADFQARCALEGSIQATHSSMNTATIETDIIDRLFLELSQITTAKTKREIALEAELADRLEADGERCAKLCMATGNVRNASKKALELCYQIERCGASTELTQASIMASALSAELDAMLSDLQRDAYQSASAKPQPPLGRMSIKDSMSTTAIAGQLYETYCQSVGGKAFNGDPLPTWREFHADTTKQKQVNAWLNVAIEAAYQFGLTTRPAEPVTARYSRPGDAGPG